jgi:acetylornithine deacetylase/succinyl-diaminopimelate desuccinylase-like protein
MRRFLLAGCVLLVAAAACRRERAAPPPITPSEAADLKRPPAEWLREEPIRLLADYVRIDTRAEKGEREGALFLQRLFECDGIETELVCPTGNRCNLLARLPGRTSSGALLLLNHIDVADAFPDYWKEAPPFEARIKNGYLYGRGAYDMKSLGLIELLAMRRLRRLGVVPATDILFLAEADEEIGQKWGSRWLLAHRPEWFRGVEWVINEGGTTEMLLRTPRYWGIETLLGGFASAEFEAPTREAVERFAERFPRLTAPAVEPHPQVVAAFEMLANHLSSPITEPMRHLDRVRRDPAELALLPDRYGSFLEPRLHWSDPYVHPSRPDRVRRYVSVAVPPGVPPGPYLAPIVEAAKKAGLTVLETLDSGPTKASRYPSPLTDLLERVTEAHFPGVPFGPVPGFGGFTTSIFLRDAGMQVYGYSPIPMNITDAARRHWNDERLYLRDYLDGVALFDDVLLEYASGTAQELSQPPPKR